MKKCWRGVVSWVLTDSEPPGWMTAPWLDLVLAPASVSRYFWPYAPRSSLYPAVAQQLILPSSSSPRGTITSLDCC